MIQAAGPYIRNGGRIINISTGFTRVAGPTHTIYSAFKGAIETLTLAVVILAASEEARWMTGQFIDATGGTRL